MATNDEQDEFQVTPMEHNAAPNGMQEFKFPDEQELSPDENDDPIEVVVEDDTPPEDRGRDPMPGEVVEDLENDDLEEYSEKVKQRMRQLRKVWHDERRAREAREREQAEAVRVAQKLLHEQKRLREAYAEGEKLLVQTAAYAAQADLAMAERDYREAYDAGDTDKVLEAQRRIQDASFRLDKIKNYQPTALQTAVTDVHIPTQAPEKPKLSTKTQEWVAKNPWFGPGPGKNREMTSLAMGVHEQLIEEGVSPDTDEYFKRIDAAVHRRFPEYFQRDQRLQKDTKKSPSSVVAPAARAAAPKRIRLTASQVAFAKKCGMTPEQYARELQKLENSNG